MNNLDFVYKVILYLWVFKGYSGNPQNDVFMLYCVIFAD